MPGPEEAFVIFQKILVAVDGEPVSAHAADVATELAQLAGAEMAFVHVLDPELVNAADTGIQPDVFAASAKEDARKLIDDFRKRLPQQLAALDFVPIGSPHTEIVNAARDWPADLIVMGQPDPERAGPGADALVEEALFASGRPVLLTPHASAVAGIGRRALIGWNASREASRAVHDALPLLLPRDMRAA